MLLTNGPCQHSKTLSTHLLYHMQSLPCSAESLCTFLAYRAQQFTKNGFQAGSGITKADQKPLPVHL